MDPTTVSYYRAILFRDAEDRAQLPKGLLELHAWTVKRHQALGLGPTVQKAVALTIALTWLSSTADGREFAKTQTTLGDFFCDLSSVAEDASGNEWKSVPVGTKVICEEKGKTKEGTLAGVHDSWLDVMIDGQRKNFRSNKVVLAQPTTGV